MTQEKIKYPMFDIMNQMDILIKKIAMSGWTPEIIVGITRGGLVPAVFISHKTNIPMITLDVRLRDGEAYDEIGCESNAWLAEWAYGYEGDPKRILIIDDINDTGATLQWIKQDWQASVSPNEDKWNNEIWHKTTRFATLIDNTTSNFTVDYRCDIITKDENGLPWVVFPWEDQWEA